MINAPRRYPKKGAPRIYPKVSNPFVYVWIVWLKDDEGEFPVTKIGSCQRQVSHKADDLKRQARKVWKGFSRIERQPSLVLEVTSIAEALSLEQRAIELFKPLAYGKEWFASLEVEFIVYGVRVLAGVA